MFLLSRGAFIALIYALFPATVAAETKASTITFEEVLAAGLTTSPAAREIISRKLASRATAAGLRVLEQPELSTELRPSISGHKDRDMEYEVSVAQPLTLGAFGKKQEVARLIDEQATVEEKLLIFELTQSLKLLYGKAWAFQEYERQTEQARQRAAELSEKLHRLAHRGFAPESISMLLQAERARLEADVEGIRSDRSRAVAELIRSTGLPLREKKLTPFSNKLSEPILHSFATEGLPLVQRAKLGARIAAAQEQLARLDSFPKFAPRLGFEHTSDGDDRIQVGISIALPFSSQKQAGRVSAAAFHKKESARESYLESSAFRQELDLLKGAALASSKQTAIYNDTVLPALQSALVAAESEWEAGQGAVVQVWQTFLALTEAQERYLELWTNALSQRVELSILLGQDI